MTGPGRSMIDQALQRRVRDLRAEHGPLGLDLPEHAVRDERPEPLTWEGDQA